MALPGVNVVSRQSPPAQGNEINTGTWFVAGFAERGPSDSPVLIRNMTQYEDKLGLRIAPATGLYDALDTYFREGGARAYVSRVFGPNPTKATANLSDGTGNTLRVDASSPGAWGADLDIIVTHPTGTTFKIQVNYKDSPVESSPELADNAAAVAWAQGSDFVDVTDLGGTDPVAATTALAGGNDDNANATDATWKTALNRFTKDHGPGQVSMPGRTAAQAHVDLLAHAAANNRVAILDITDDPLAANLESAVAAIRAGSNARYGSVFAPWAVVPGIALGTTRTVPYSAVQAGMIARLEGLGRNPNEAAAGVDGIAQYAIGLSQPAWDDSTREDLNDAGVNVARVINNQVRTYGYRTPVDPLVDPTWIAFTNSRLYMAIAALCDDVGERYVFQQIDGKRKTISRFNGDLVSVLIPYWEQGALFGETFHDAARVDTGDQVNTPETIANRELHAVVTVAMSPFGEVVTIEIVKVTNTEG